jgi:hypothetical protein
VGEAKWPNTARKKKNSRESAWALAMSDWTWANFIGSA